MTSIIKNIQNFLIKFFPITYYYLIITLRKNKKKLTFYYIASLFFVILLFYIGFIAHGVRDISYYREMFNLSLMLLCFVSAVFCGPYTINTLSNEKEKKTLTLLRTSLNTYEIILNKLYISLIYTLIIIFPFVSLSFIATVTCSNLSFLKILVGLFIYFVITLSYISFAILSAILAKKEFTAEMIYSAILLFQHYFIIIFDYYLTDYDKYNNYISNVHFFTSFSPIAILNSYFDHTVYYNKLELTIYNIPDYIILSVFYIFFSILIILISINIFDNYLNWRGE